MTLGNLKKKIYSVLAIDETTELPALCYAIDSTARKVASLCRCIKRKADITFAGGKAEAPADFICAAAEMPVIDFYDGKLTIADGESATIPVVYYAYPEEVTDSTDNETELPYGGMAFDAVAYGAAGELCASVRPGDVRRYLEIMTEYDERIAGMYSANIKSVSPAVFCGARRIRR